MSQSANVRSVESIHDFKVAMTTFADDAHNALGSVEMEIRRTRDWLQRDQLSHWQAAVKRGNEFVSMMRTELHRRRLSQANSDAISDAEQKENLRKALRKLEEAEEKVRKIKSWVPILDHAIAEYHAASQPLGDRLTGTFHNSLSLLERTIASLDSYLNLQAPTAPQPTAAESADQPSAAVSQSVGSESPGRTEPAVKPTATGEARPDEVETTGHPHSQTGA